eukprot:UN24367
MTIKLFEQRRSPPCIIFKQDEPRVFGATIIFEKTLDSQYC